MIADTADRSIVRFRVDFRFPKSLSKKRNSWDIYDCYWKEGIPIEMEVSEITVDAVITAMESMEKPDNGCDAMRIKMRMNVGNVEVKLERDIDIHFHTAIFHDGRRVQYWTTQEDGRKSASRLRCNEALAAAGYHDLIIH